VAAAAAADDDADDAAAAHPVQSNHTSHITHHTSNITHHTSHITPVCDQRSFNHTLEPVPLYLARLQQRTPHRTYTVQRKKQIEPEISFDCSRIMYAPQPVVTRDVVAVCHAMRSMTAAAALAAMSGEWMSV
jgi:hypothetical protein